MLPPGLRDRVTFVICTEPGVLERKSVMLVKTLRAFGGRFAPCPVLSYSPREGRTPHRRTLEFFRRSGVKPVLEPINRRLDHYAFGNKAVACAHAEEHWPRDRLVFLDSDTFVLSEPAHLWSKSPHEVKIRPVEQKLGGSNGSDQFAEYWRKLMHWAGIAHPAYVRTSLTGERIYGYWNAGVISGPGDSGFFRQWLTTLTRLLDEGLDHPAGLDFMDQIALALTLGQESWQPIHLPKTYNVPVGVRPRTPDRESLPPPEEIVVAHYHKTFDHFPLRNPLEAAMPSGRRPHLKEIIQDSGLVGFKSYVRYRLRSRIRALLTTRAP